MKFWLVCVMSFVLGACASPSLKPAHMEQLGDLQKYRYVLIEDVPTMSAARVINGQGFTQELVPTQLIEGMLLKKGLVRVAKPSPAFLDTLLLAKWGISGKRDVSGLISNGYTQEVTIRLMSADTMMPVFVCSAEGFGSTEVDDIREAITRCLAGL